MNNFFQKLLLVATFCFSSWAAATDEVGVDVTDAGQKQPLFLTLFIHDEIQPAELARLGPDHLEWFSKELSQTTGRKVSVITVRNEPGYTDFNYQMNDHNKAGDQWLDNVVRYTRDNNKPLDTRRHKYILVTQNPLSPAVLGVAAVNGASAIASMATTFVLGHEIGHLFGATHDNSETSFASFPPCLTLMAPNKVILVSTCQRFSDKNRDAIYQYLSDSP